jgi:hypothetical protein
MRSVPRCYEQDESRILLVGRYSPANTSVKSEGATVLKAVTRRQPVKVQQTESI